MKKVFFEKKALCLFLVSVFFAASLFAKGPSLHTEVASIDNHGNVNLKVSGTLFAAKGFGLGDFVTVKIGKQSFLAPVTKNYTDVDRGAYLLRINGDEVSLAVNMGNFARQFDLAVGNPVTITMKKRLGFLRTYQTRLLSKSNDRSDFASDEAFANFRAVKAGRLADGRLFRSCNPIESDERAPFAASLAEKAGVSLVLNLADSEEAAQARLDQAPYYRQLSLSGKVCYLELGASFTDSKSLKAIRQGLLFLVENQGSVLIHGKEGRTRTGMLCMLLEAFCGATIDEIALDYMATFENYYNVRDGSVQYGALVQAVPDFFKELNGGKPVTDKNVQAVSEKFLLKSVGLSKEQLEALRLRLQA